ncbi:MAG: hypothetical protein V7752_07425 [Halopseudomonas sp.]
MGKPTEVQLQQALATAKEMRERGHDPHFVAKALLNSQYRLERLEEVIKLADHYLKAGQDEQNHARLVRAIEHYHQLEERTEAVDHLRFGLD